MQLYYGYKTTNLTNSRFYYGVRKCKCNYDIFGDNYFGSGKILKQAIRKNGIENFNKEFVLIFGNRKEAYDWERDLITQDFIDTNPLCYNIKPGGEGGSPFGKNSFAFGKMAEKNGFYGKKHSMETKRKLSTAIYGIKRSDETKKRLQDSHSGEKCFWYGKSLTEEHRKRLSESHIGKKHSNETKLKMQRSHLGKKLTEEHKRNISLSRRRNNIVGELNDATL